MERKIGEIFEYNGEWYQCVKEISVCKECAFGSNLQCLDSKSIRGECQKASRLDKGVIFKKLEKVGEPFPCRNMSSGRYGIIVQWYKVFVEPILTDDSTLSWYNSINETILIALNNKEDMEKGNNPNLSNSENIGKNLKPFDLQAAKSGKPVCIRSGAKARIICFDAKSDAPIIALITTDDGTEIAFDYLSDGTFFNSENPDNDLMMLPEKKEGWIVVRRSDIYENEEEAREALLDSYGALMIRKITWEE